MEHRWGHRWPLNRMVRVRTREGLAARARLLNASISGALVRTRLNVPMLSYLRIEVVTLRDGASVIETIEGQVIRSPRTGFFAIEWCEFAPSVIRELLGPASQGVGQPLRPAAQLARRARIS